MSNARVDEFPTLGYRGKIQTKETLTVGVCKFAKNYFDMSDMYDNYVTCMTTAS